jgi:hypothetical protein
MNEIFRSDKILSFWPSHRQNPKERVLATTRFILYLSCILYIIRRDVRILLVGTLSLVALYYMYKNGMISDSTMPYTQKVASPDNPMNNGLGGTVGPPDRASLTRQWDSIHPFMEGRWFAEHNFYTAPTLESSDFVDAAYGGMYIPTCRDNPSFCNPDSKWGRGLDSVERRGTGPHKSS